MAVFVDLRRVIMHNTSTSSSAAASDDDGLFKLSEAEDQGGYPSQYAHRSGQRPQCRPPDESARQPCERCALRGLVCQYVSVTAHREELGFDSINKTTAAATSSNAQGSPPGPRLPHTGPPPLNQLPRYFGQSLPDLSLSSNYGAQPTTIPSGPNLRSTDSRFSPSLLAAWVTPLGPMAGHPSANQGDLLVTSSSAANQRTNFTDYQDPFNCPYSGQG
ncbi:hypothetical protein FB451DRAFT_1529720 [Mycena latifolia]|nr:hypothetical protein FB451DRAFT_1529720 [Mycena latifolia]